MNGRGGDRFSPHRTDYWSVDDGATWTNGTKSELLDDDGHGCERSLAFYDGTIFALEPQGKKRKKMVMACSHDAGRTWGSSTLNLNGDARGGIRTCTWSPPFLPPPPLLPPLLSLLSGRMARFQMR